jgi:uncharacterized membrane protein
MEDGNPLIKAPYTELKKYPDINCQEVQPGGISEKMVEISEIDSKLNTKAFIEKLLEYARRRGLDPIATLQDVLDDLKGYADLIKDRADKKKYNHCAGQQVIPTSAGAVAGALAGSAAATATSFTPAFALASKLGINIDVGAFVGAAVGAAVDAATSLFSGKRPGGITGRDMGPMPCIVTDVNPKDYNRYVGWKSDSYKLGSWATLNSNAGLEGSTFEMCRMYGPIVDTLKKVKK